MSLAGRAGLWFLYATGIVFLALELLSFAGVTWSRASVLAACAVLSFAASRLPALPRASAHRSPLDAAIALYAAAYVSFAAAGAPWIWDYWAIWGLKARTFFERGEIDFAFLSAPWNVYAHPDYPLLVPLNLTFPSIVFGAWSDRWLGLLFAAWALAAALVVRDLASRELSPHFASGAGLSMLALTASRYVGLAEVPLIAFGTTGLLFTRRALVGEKWARIPAAILLGLAASTKNEGLTLLLAVAIALALFGRRLLVIPLGATLIAAPWLIARAMHDLPVSLAGGGMLDRLASRLSELGRIAARLLERTADPWLWALIVMALILARRERFLVMVVALQLVCFLAVYLVTPPDVVWHIETSWGRLSRQLLAPASYAALAALAARFFQRSAHEARPES